MWWGWGNYGGRIESILRRSKAINDDIRKELNYIFLEFCRYIQKFVGTCRTSLGHMTRRNAKMFHVPTKMLKEITVLECENTKNFSLAPLARTRYCIPDVGVQMVIYSLLLNISCNVS